MSKETKIALFVLASFVISGLHGLLQGIQCDVDLFLFSDTTQDIQWYVKDIGDKLAVCFLAYAGLLMAENKTYVKNIFQITLFAMISDIILYVLFYNSHWLLFLVVIILLAIVIINKERSHTHEKK